MGIIMLFLLVNGANCINWFLFFTAITIKHVS